MKYIFVILSAVLFGVNAYSQDDDIDALVDELSDEQTVVETAAFKSTRIINGHSIERIQEGELDFRVSHRFDRLNKGLYEFFGLDESTTYLSLEYGITDWLMAGIGRSTYHKKYNGFLKYSMLRQSTGRRSSPLFISLFGSISASSIKMEEDNPGNPLNARLEYTIQAMLARKFNSSFSLQFTPTLLHRNLVYRGDDNDIYALGIAARYKLTNWVSVNAEYFYVHNKDTQKGNTYYNPIAIGFDIETGGHVFQLHFTNSMCMTESSFLGETTGDFFEGDIHFGFNISRVFTLY